jgi:hypothetical protein
VGTRYPHGWLYGHDFVSDCGYEFFRVHGFLFACTSMRRQYPSGMYPVSSVAFSLAIMLLVVSSCNKKHEHQHAKIIDHPLLHVIIIK